MDKARATAVASSLAAAALVSGLLASSSPASAGVSLLPLSPVHCFGALDPGKLGGDDEILVRIGTPKGLSGDPVVAETSPPWSYPSK